MDLKAERERAVRLNSDISPESKLLMNSLILGLQNIERDYGKSYINVKFKEV